MPKDCLFCHIPPSEYIIHNKYFYSRFDRYPSSPGHFEVIPKKHIESFLELTDKELIAMYRLLIATLKIIERTDLQAIYEEWQQNPLDARAAELYRLALTHSHLNKKPNGHTFGINEGEAAGRSIHHFHYHSIPRYIGDHDRPEGGIRQVLPKTANYR